MPVFNFIHFWQELQTQQQTFKRCVCAMERSYLSLQRALCCATSLHNFDMSLLQNRVTEIQTTAQVGLHYRCGITFSYTSIQKFFYYSASCFKKVNTVLMLHNISVSNKGCSFQLSINQIIIFSTEILSNTAVVNIDKIREHQIRILE